MNDQGIDEIIAEVMGSESTPDTPESPIAPDETLDLQDATQVDNEEQAESASAEADPDSGEAEEPVPFETLQQQWTERESAMQERITAFEQREVEAQARADQLQAWKAQAARHSEDVKAQEFAKQIEDELGSEYAKQFQERRGFIAQDRDAGWQRVGVVENALDSWVLALEHEAPDIASRIEQRALSLLQYGTPQERQQALQSEREQSAASSARESELRSLVETLQMQLEAQKRPPQADVVDGSRSGAAGQDWQNATDFESQFDRWIQDTPWAPPA